jgi:hypothetical protein
MSSFDGRRAPGVSQQIAALNSLPSTHQPAPQQQQQDAFGLEDDLALYTNAQFFDFDMGENHEPIDYDPEHELRARRENAAAAKHSAKGLDFLNCTYRSFLLQVCCALYCLLSAGIFVPTRDTPAMHVDRQFPPVRALGGFDPSQYIACIACSSPKLPA